MHWLDQTLATPAIGVVSGPVFRTGSEIFVALRPMLQRWATEAIETSADQQAGPFAAKLHRQDGYTIEILNDQVVGTFSYRGAIRELPGELAKLTFTTPTTPYSVLLAKCLALTTETLDAISPGRAVRRIGVVAECRMETSSVPPGVEALRRHLASPWSSGLDTASATLVAELQREGTYVDRCHHVLDFNEVERPKDTRLRLDWQRQWNNPIQMKKGDKKLIDKCVSDAMKYFEGFAGGDLNYADQG